jgi:hypothetical protein
MHLLPVQYTCGFLIMGISFIFNPDFAGTCKICTDASAGIYNTDAMVIVKKPEGSGVLA